MLNDLFISRDVLGYLVNYANSIELKNSIYLEKLKYFQSRKYMSYEQWWRLLNDLEEIVQTEALGIDIGKQIKAEHVGVLGYLFKTSENLAEALNCFLRFQRLIYAGSLAEIISTPDNNVVMQWNPDEGYSVQTSDEILIAAMINIVRQVIHPRELKLNAVHFTQPLTKSRLRCCEEFFGCPVFSASKKLSISLSANDLSIPVPQSDTTLHSILGAQAQDLLNELPDSDTFLANVRDVIIRSLHQGKSDATYIAKMLNISERTLHRRLKSKSRVYREILRDIRKSLVINYLNDPKLTLAETALLLGYSEQSSFTRAFTAWYGCPPKEYLRRNT